MPSQRRDSSYWCVFIAALLMGSALPARAQEPSPVPPGTAPSAAPAPSASPSADSAGPSPAALFFGKRCGGCHSIGEGDRAGPDLLGVMKRRDRKWLTAFIRGPSAVIDSGDSTANELLNKFKGARMPDQALSDDELNQTFAYLEECSLKGGCKLATAKVKPAKEATPADIAAGKALFEGSEALLNGGAPCISCHNVRGAGLVGGGTLAKDLTHAYARLGEQGTSSALASTPFPIMKDLYGKKPLSDQEAFRLKAFLYSASADPAAPPTDHDFFYIGALAALVSFGAISAAWGKRLRGVRKSIVERGAR